MNRGFLLRERKKMREKVRGGARPKLRADDGRSGNGRIVNRIELAHDDAVSLRILCLNRYVDIGLFNLDCRH